MMKRLLLALLLLFGTHTVVVAGNFEDGMAAILSNDYVTALPKLKKAAMSGNVSAQVMVGAMYYEGLGVPKDYAQAARWYTKAAEAGNASAQYTLGKMYADGEGVARDYLQAVRWITKAAEAGDAEAQNRLGLMYETGSGVAQDYEQAVRWNTKAAEAGDGRAQLRLGLMYENGRGVPQDYLQAVRWHTKAAEAGDPIAQWSLARMYEAGQGVSQDYVQAVRWYTKAAEKLLEAEISLGWMYFSGKGVAQDYLQAMLWFTKAAEVGDTRAQRLVGMMYVDGKGVAQDYVQAARWYTKAAEAGDADGQAMVGAMYHDGIGLPQNYILAHMWYNLAAAQGNKQASENRDLTAKRMTSAQIAEAQKLAREWKPTTGTASDRRQDTGRREPEASGTGFVISRQGHVLTNNHVIEGCKSIRSTNEGRKQPLTVVATDSENDLALLKLPSPSPNIARFREGRTIRAGDGVVAVGFPLHGLLAAEANVTTGAVSALAGLGNDTRFLQITAPIQPGNSGGPLLDQGGNIVGVIVSSLNAFKIAKATGSLPQNINFAINGAVAKSFLDANSVEYELASSGKRLESSDVGGQAKKFTLLLECFK